MKTQSMLRTSWQTTILGRQTNQFNWKHLRLSLSNLRHIPKALLNLGTIERKPPPWFEPFGTNEACTTKCRRAKCCRQSQVGMIISLLLHSSIASRATWLRSTKHINDFVAENSGVRSDHQLDSSFSTACQMKPCNTCWNNMMDNDLDILFKQNQESRMFCPSAHIHLGSQEPGMDGNAICILCQKDIMNFTFKNSQYSTEIIHNIIVYSRYFLDFYNTISKKIIYVSISHNIIHYHMSHVDIFSTRMNLI